MANNFDWFSPQQPDVPKSHPDGYTLETAMAEWDKIAEHWRTQIQELQRVIDIHNKIHKSHLEE